jgi:hypothetical protein
MTKCSRDVVDLSPLVSSFLEPLFVVITPSHMYVLLVCVICWTIIINNYKPPGIKKQKQRIVEQDKIHPLNKNGMTLPSKLSWNLRFSRVISLTC